MTVETITLSMIRARRGCRAFLWKVWRQQQVDWRLRSIVALYLGVHFSRDLRMTWSYEDVETMIYLLGLDKGGSKCR